MTPLIHICNEVKAAAQLKEWFDKLNKILNDNGYKEGEPAESIVLEEYALDLLYEYNEKIHTSNGAFSDEHRTPGQREIDVFTTIILAVLVDRQITGEFEKRDVAEQRIKEKLKELCDRKENEVASNN